MTNDGIIGVYKLVNTADAGYMPVMKLTHLFDAYFSRQRVGINRLYAALGVDAQIDAVFRLWNTRIEEAMPKDLYAVFVNGEDVTQYRIALVQDVVERDAVDITVEKVDQFYAIEDESGDGDDAPDQAQEPG